MLRLILAIPVMAVLSCAAQQDMDVVATGTREDAAGGAAAACRNAKPNSFVGFHQNWCKPRSRHCSSEIGKLPRRHNGSREMKGIICGGWLEPPCPNNRANPRDATIVGCLSDEVRSIALCRVSDYSLIVAYDHGHGAEGKDHAKVYVEKSAGELNLCVGSFNGDWEDDGKHFRVDFIDGDPGDGRKVDGKIDLIEFWPRT